MRSLFAVWILGLTMFADAPSDPGIVAVESLLKDHAKAWNEENVEMMTNLFAEDGERVSSNGSVAHGRKEIEASYRKTLESIQFKHSSHKVTKILAKHVTADVILADVDWTATGLHDVKGKPREDINGSSVVVLRKEGDRWEIFSLRARASED